MIITAIGYIIAGCLVSAVLASTLYLLLFGERNKLFFCCLLACAIAIPFWCMLLATFDFHISSSKIVSTNETYYLEEVLAVKPSIITLGLTDSSTLAKYKISERQEVVQYLQETGISDSDKFNKHMYDTVTVKVSNKADIAYAETRDEFIKSSDDSCLSTVEITIQPTGEEVHIEGVFDKEIKDGNTVYTLGGYTFDDNKNTSSILNFADSTNVTMDIICDSSELQKGIISKCKLRNIKHANSDTGGE